MKNECQQQFDEYEQFEGEDQWQKNDIFQFSEHEYNEQQNLQINNSNVSLNPDISDGTLSSINEKMFLYEFTKQMPNKYAPKTIETTVERINPLNPMTQFPPNKEIFQNIQSHLHLKQIIETEKIKYGRKDLKYTIRHYKRENWQNIAVYCISCKNEHTSTIGVKKMTLIRRQSSGKFILKYFDNKHSHTNNLTKNTQKMKNKIKTIKEEFHNASKSMTINAFIEYMQSKYNLNPKLIKHGLYCYKRQNQNFTQVLDLIQKCNAKCWLKNQAEDEQYINDQIIQMADVQPEIFILVYNQMYARFEQVGDVCYVTLLNFRLKRTVESEKQDKHWDIFTLTGLTLNYIMEPFSMTYIEQSLKTPQMLAQVMIKLFQIFNKVPKVLITPNQSIFDETIAMLYEQQIFRGIHLYDPIWQMDKIGAELDRYQDLSLFKNIIFSRTHADYINSIQKLMEICEPTPKIRRQLNKIMKNSHKLCFSCIKTFEHIGTIFDYSGNKLIVDAIKQHLFRFIYKAHQNQLPITHLKYAHVDSKRSCGPIRSKHNIDNTKLNFSRITFTRCAKALMVFMRRSIVSVNSSSNYDIKPYQQVVEIPEIRTIRKSIKSNTLNAFGQQYGRVYNLIYFQRKVASNQPNSFRVFDMYDKTAKSLFIVSPYPQYLKDGSLDKIIWKCNCLFSFKCGVPCAHQILACMVSKSSLFQLFKKEYTVFQKYKRVGRPKSTRRNTEK